MSDRGKRPVSNSNNNNTVENITNRVNALAARLQISRDNAIKALRLHANQVNNQAAGPSRRGPSRGRRQVRVVQMPAAATGSSAGPAGERVMGSRDMFDQIARHMGLENLAKIAMLSRMHRNSAAAAAEARNRAGLDRPSTFVYNGGSGAARVIRKPLTGEEIARVRGQVLQYRHVLGMPRITIRGIVAIPAQRIKDKMFGRRRLTRAILRRLDTRSVQNISNGDLRSISEVVVGLELQGGGKSDLSVELMRFVLALVANNDLRQGDGLQSELDRLSLNALYVIVVMLRARQYL